MSNLKGKEILITGGAGTLGKEIVKKLLKSESPRGIRIYSRDEEKHRLFKKELNELGLLKNIAFLVGDIRDLNRLNRAMNCVDIVIHAAAMKQVPSCENDPIEAVKTNVDGTANVIEAAVNNIVEKVMLISTDKACYPINLYGSTKATAEKLFLHANIYSPNSTIFSICRYGNVIGSRGSVIQVWNEQLKDGLEITLTNGYMTRFWIKLSEVATFVLDRIKEMEGEEIFIPKMKSLDMETLAKIVVDVNESSKPIILTGIRKGEKLHECLITKEESLCTCIKNKSYMIIKKENPDSCIKKYSSYDAEEWDEEELKDIIKEII